MKTNYLSLLFFILAAVSSFFRCYAQNCNNSNLVIDVDFDQNTGSSLYNISRATQDFGAIRARTSGQIRGLDGNGNSWPHKTRVVNGVLRAEYLKNSAGGPNGGFLFDKEFASAEEAVLEYRVKFDAGFVWAYGGKLPGLGGSSLSSNGAIPAGCTRNNNSIKNGFSCRLMWRSNGGDTPARLVVYTYFPDRDISKCGENETIIRGLEKNRWYTIKQYLKLNTPGQNNGIIKMFIDGVEELTLNNVKFRESGKGNVKINDLIMNTYRGGSASDQRWWSPTTDYAYFDSFKVWTNCDNVTEGNDGVNRAPSVSFTTPSGNIIVNEGYNDLYIEANASDSDGSISKVELFIDDELVRSEGLSPYEWGHASFVTETTGLSVGNHIFKVVATDNEGEISQDSFTLTVENPNLNIAPSIQFMTPSGNKTVTQGYDNLYLLADASDSDGSISKVELFIDDQFVRKEGLSPYEWGYTGFEIETTGLSVGNHIFKVVATDNEGEISQDSFTLTVENPNLNIAPSIQFMTPSGNKTVTQGYDNLYLLADASDIDGSISKVELFIDDRFVRKEGLSPYEWGYTGFELETTGLSVGSHIFKVVATDNDGNVSQDSFTLTVNNFENDVEEEIRASCTFGTPRITGISNLNKEYNNIYVVGSEAPDLSSVKKFSVNWSSTYNDLYSFALNTKNGIPSYYVDLKNKTTYNLNSAFPEVTLNNTGILGLDGSYWVNTNVDSFILVSKSSDFSIHFRSVAIAPSCSSNRSLDANVDQLIPRIYPSPFSDYLSIVNLPKEASRVSVYDIKGMRLMSFSLNQMKKSSSFSLKTSHLKHGLYLVRIKLEDGMHHTFSVIKK
ncbi:polysaccharide lyase [uncultured Nonlabens sp.]|uniref:polysaccharide lyase n=1 Tax=uncultured Nonlabens sp. TaxID=859306 RepID=UPI00261A785E|nr:Ig-like domain-containing protein [uncultured Nonlabens sp.]